MTRRARILTALNGGVPDRPPIAFDACTGALDGVYAHYGAQTKNDLYTIAGIDGFSVWEWNAVMGRYVPETGATPDGLPLDFWGGCSQRAYGLGHLDGAAAVAAHPWPRAADFDFSHIHAQALAIQAQDMVVSAGHLGLGYQKLNELRGNENALTDVLDDAFMEAYMARLTDFTLAYIDALLTAGRGEVAVVRADDDVGTMDRLMINPATWRRWFKPAWRAAFDVVHRHGAKVWFHSCGYIAPLLDDLIEIGADVWNPFPSYVKDNDHDALRDFRKGRLVLDGGVNHLVLVNGTPDEVRAETRRVLDTFAPDGGLLIGPSQVFTEDMPTANILAFFETALQG
jgi:uroporphyrinogen decarboxylase